jgi:hypothetical protein
VSSGVLSVSVAAHLLLSGAQGETWQAVIKGHELDPMAQQQDQQRLLLERFQREVRLLASTFRTGAPVPAPFGLVRLRVACTDRGSP